MHFVYHFLQDQQRAFVFGPGTINNNLDSDTNLIHSPGYGGEQVVSTYNNSSGNSDNFSGSFQYQLSFLDKDHTLILNLDKDAELFDGIGSKGLALLPQNSSPQIKNNLEYYLEKAGIIESTTSTIQNINPSAQSNLQQF